MTTSGSCGSAPMDISPNSTSVADVIYEGNVNQRKRTRLQSPMPDAPNVAKRLRLRAPKRPTALDFSPPPPTDDSGESADSILDSSASSGSEGCFGPRLLKRSRFDETFNYRKLRNLGHGGNGNCFLLERRSDKALRVCKVTFGRANRGHANLPHEVRLLRNFLPPNDRILRAYEAIQGPRQCQLYFDYCDGGDLSDLIRYYGRFQTLLPESFIWHAFLQLSEALAFIHHGYDHRLGWQQTLPADWHPVIHADVKPENVFLRLPTNSWDYPSLVLGDFGAAQLQPGVGYIGTYQWMPPEIPTFSCKSDVWSLGAVIHAMAHSGQPPIAALPPQLPNTAEGYRDWCCHPGSRDIQPLLEYSVDLEDTMLEAMRWDVQDRYTSYEMLMSVRFEIEDGVAAKEIFEPLLAGWGAEKTGKFGGGWWEVGHRNTLVDDEEQLP